MNQIQTPLQQSEELMREQRALYEKQLQYKPADPTYAVNPNVLTTQVVSQPVTMQDKQANQTLQTQAFTWMHQIANSTPGPLAPPTDEQAQARSRALETKSVRNEFYDNLKERCKANAGLLSENEMNDLELLRQTKWGQEKWMTSKTQGATQAEHYDKALSGDFSSFEHLDVTLRNSLATRFMKNNFTMPLPDQTPGEYAEAMRKSAGVDALMNPLFRLGISLAMHSGGFNGIPGEYFKELDCYCCSEILLSTLTRQIDDTQRGALEQQLGHDGAADAISRNTGSQILLAKHLLLLQMSDFRQVNTDEKTKQVNSVPWQYSMASAFGHCSRISFILPPLNAQNEATSKQEHQRFWTSLRELKQRNLDGYGGNTCGMFKRGSSTHGMQCRTVSGTSYKEEKKVANFFGQEGVNISVGGLGLSGIGGRTLLNNGSCGHLYTMREESTTSKYGGFLAGVESDSFQKTNQLGHTHGLGNPEYASSFGGQRTDEIGDKYGGRQADLSGMSLTQVTGIMDMLEDYMRLTSHYQEDSTPIMQLLVGKKMDDVTWPSFLMLLSSETERLTRLHGPLN